MGISGYEFDVYRAPPLLGEHNEEVLGGLLGRPREVVDAINAARDEVLRTHE